MAELLEKLREDISWLGACETERQIISHIEYAMKLLKEQEAKIEQLNRFVNGFSRNAMPVVRCKDCKYRSFYCTEATDGTTLYECHHPCANSVSRPGYWFCADGKRKEGR